MPRPGPRPYECVKRAWHSDRHQPIRGSIIREIFRIANEAHSQTTRKNREWQEKLPSVVFKAEEILYSKAGSEDEYVEMSTLWKRVNDAVDTIIRRDDANESGDLLLPCIEAALTVGCVPRRTSRSQRHSHPRSYLSPGQEEVKERTPASCSQRCIGDGDPRQLLGHHAPYQLLANPPWASSGRVYPLFSSNWSEESSSRTLHLQDDCTAEERDGDEEALAGGGFDLSLSLGLPPVAAKAQFSKDENFRVPGNVDSGSRMGRELVLEPPSKKRGIENDCLGLEWRPSPGRLFANAWDGKTWHGC
ncbi:uncharacterized protein LOC144700485 [Wolffia australiana]